jgi:hypothetical protein
MTEAELKRVAITLMSQMPLEPGDARRVIGYLGELMEWHNDPGQTGGSVVPIRPSA